MPSAAAGSEARVSVSFVAPNQPGKYRGYWRLHSNEGRPFGHRVWVETIVEEAAADRAGGGAGGGAASGCTIDRDKVRLDEVPIGRGAFGEVRPSAPPPETPDADVGVRCLPDGGSARAWR